MKTSPLVLQLTEARPRKGKGKAKVPPPEAAPVEPVNAPSELDSAKGEAFATYEEDWRYKALDEFNIEQGTEFHIDDNQANENEKNRMEFHDGGTEWIIFQDSDTAETAAIERVTDDLNDSPENFNADFIKSHVNQEKLKNTLWSDVREHRSEDFDEMDDDDKADALERAGVISDKSEVFLSRKEFIPVSEQQIAQLFAEFIEHLKATTTDEAAVAKGFKDAEQYIRSEHARLAEMDDEDFIKALIADSGFPIDEDDYFTDEQSGINEELIDSLKETYLDKLGEEFDPMEWLNDIYGEEEAQKEAVRIGGIDVDAAAKEAVSTDGWAHFLNHYDGNYSELHSGAVYFRSN